MSRYLEFQTNCPVCGNRIEGRRLIGYTTMGPADLDTNPHHRAIYDRVLICPHCGYTSENMEVPANDATRAAVGSEAYQELLRREDLTEASRKMLLFALLAEARGEARRAAYAVLAAYWDGLESGRKDVGLLRRAVGIYDRYLTEHKDIDAAMILLDLLRQAGSFADAKETGEFLLPLIGDAYRQSIVRFELELIARGDDAPHSQSEVTGR